MGGLTDSQLKFRLNRQFKEDKALKNKMETQKQKEIYGKDWMKTNKKAKETEMKDFLARLDDAREEQELQKLERSKENGTEYTDDQNPRDGYSLPTIYDSIDISDFFKPIEALKDKYGDDFKFYFDKYTECKEAFQDVIDSLDKEIYKTTRKGRPKGSTKKTKSKEDRRREEVNERLEKARDATFKDIYNFFQQFVPIYDTYVCSCCGRPLDITKFYRNFDLSDLSHLDNEGNVRTHICKDCTHKLFNYLYSRQGGKDAEKTMKMLCATLNIYWDVNYLNKALMNSKLNENENHIVHEYFAVLYNEPDAIGKTFMDSPFLDEKYKPDMGKRVDVKGKDMSEEEQRKLDIDDINSGLLHWSKEDLNARKQVIRYVGYDCFDYETDENRRQLYGDLLNILEPGMEQDGVKLQAAIQIVTSFLKIREMNRQYKQMQSEGATLNDLKTLAELKQKEMTTVTKFCQDNGFSERFATAKGKGENTFTGILNKMGEDKFEDAIMNEYDIATSKTIQQAADASFDAIFKQLNMSDAEVWQTCSNQLAELRKLRQENASLQEEIRLAKYELAKNNLKKEAARRGVQVDDD